MRSARLTAEPSPNIVSGKVGFSTENINNKKPSSARLIIMVASLSLAYFFSNFHRLSLGVIGSTVAADFGLTGAQMGMLGSILFYTYALMQVPAGMIADRISAKWIITLACVGAAFGTLWFASADSFLGLTLSRGLTGVAVAFIYVPALSTLRQWFGDRVLGTMTGILVSLGQIGAVSASMPLKLAADMVGWQNTFRIIAYVSIALSAVIALTVITKPRENKKAAPLASAVPALKNIKFLAIALWFFVAGGTRLAFQGLWGSNFFTKSLTLSSNDSGMLLMYVSIGCIFGAMLLGRLSDYLGSTKTLVLSGALLTVIWVSIGAMSQGAPMWFLTLLCLLLGVFGAGGFTVAFSCVREFSGRENTGLLTGINSCTAFLGSAMFTQASGFVVDGLPSLGVPERYKVLIFGFAALCALATGLVVLCNRKNTKG